MGEGLKRANAVARRTRQKVQVTTPVVRVSRYAVNKAAATRIAAAMRKSGCEQIKISGGRGQWRVMAMATYAQWAAIVGNEAKGTP